MNIKYWRFSFHMLEAKQMGAKMGWYESLEFLKIGERLLLRELLTGGNTNKYVCASKVMTDVFPEQCPCWSAIASQPRPPARHPRTSLGMQVSPYAPCCLPLQLWAVFLHCISFSFFSVDLSVLRSSLNFCFLSVLAYASSSSNHIIPI